MERSIVEALKSACGNTNIKYQVVIQDRKLHIYVNHHSHRQPNYSLLEEKVTAAIACLSLDAIDRVYLYSRPFGTVTPNWQTELTIPQLEPIDSDEVDTIGTTQPQEVSSLGVTSHTKVREALIQNQQDTNIGDTGLLKDSGLIHGSPLQEEEINTILTGSRNKAVSPKRSVSNNYLAQYCFIPHQKLLSGDIIFPKTEIVRSIEFFHHLGDRQRQELLPILEAYFQSATKPNPDLPLAVRKWLQRIDELDREQRQMFAIWLSRYCFDPETTIAELKTATTRNARTAKIEREYRPTESSFTASKTNDDNLAKEFEQPSELNSERRSGVTILLPVGWILATAALLLIAIANNNSISNSHSALCSNSIGSPEYCRLAVNLAGKNQITPPQSFLPLTEVSETVASYGCQRYANLKAGTPNLDPKLTPARSSYGERVFPHLYVVRVEQKNIKEAKHTVVGCVYTSGQDLLSPKLLAADVIPHNWPAESYRPKKAHFTFGKLGYPIKLGLSTICAAGGIAIASGLNLGIEIGRESTIYLMALILGIVQLAASFVPALGFFSTTLISISTVIAIGFSLKDFKLHWHRNPIAVAVGIFLIVAIQFLFYGLCRAAIASLI